MSELFKDNDADISIIRTKKVCIVGYGSQGRAQALNLLESGVNIKVALRSSSKVKSRAVEEGISVDDIEPAIEWADVIVPLIPDASMPALFNSKEITSVKSSKTFVFAHGYAVHYETIKISEMHRVVLVAPSAPGKALRNEFKVGSGVPGLFSSERDDRELALSYCKAIGLTRRGVVETTFKEEVETDLFGEQVVLTGGIPKLIQTAYDVMVDAGYDSKVSWLVACYEVKNIVDLFFMSTFDSMYSSISDTAEYGSYISGDKIFNDAVKNQFKEILESIQSGKFKDRMSSLSYNQDLESFRHKYKNLGVDKAGASIIEKLKS